MVADFPSRANTDCFFLSDCGEKMYKKLCFFALACFPCISFAGIESPWPIFLTKNRDPALNRGVRRQQGMFEFPPKDCYNYFVPAAAGL